MIFGYGLTNVNYGKTVWSVMDDHGLWSTMVYGQPWLTNDHG